jgi:hypothetical protein
MTVSSAQLTPKKWSAGCVNGNFKKKKGCVNGNPIGLAHHQKMASRLCG